MAQKSPGPGLKDRDEFTCHHARFVLRSFFSGQFPLVTDLGKFRDIRLCFPIRLDADQLTVLEKLTQIKVGEGRRF